MNSIVNDPQAQSELGKTLPVRFDEIRKMLSILTNLCEQKNKAYGNAWKKRGGISAFFSFAAKLERLETWAAAHNYNLFDVTEDYSPESIDETLKDLINYFSLVLDARDQLYALAEDPTRSTVVKKPVYCMVDTPPSEVVIVGKPLAAKFVDKPKSTFVEESEELPKVSKSLVSGEVAMSLPKDFDLLHGKPADRALVNNIKKNSGAVVVEATVKDAIKTADTAFKAAAVIVAKPKEVRGRMINGVFVPDED